MSGAVSASGIDGVDWTLRDYGSPGTTAIGAEQIQQSVNDLTAQSTSGLVSPELGGLGRSISQVLGLQTQLASLDAYQQNTTLASTQLAATASALTQMNTIAQSVSTSLLSLAGESGATLQSGVASLADQARSMLGEVGSLLDTSSGGIHVFAGSGASDQAVTSAAALMDGPMSSAIGNALSGLDAEGSAATLGAILSAGAATAPGATPFNPSIGTGSLSVPVGPDGQQVATSVPVTAMGDATSTSTGSSVRDLVTVLSTLARLSTTDTTSAQFGSLVTGLRSIVAGAATGIEALESACGTSQQIVAGVSASNEAAANLATTTIGNDTSVDIATVATRLSAASTQLQASYTLVADMKNLSLAAYL